MDLGTFIQKRRPDWLKMEQMLDFAQGSGLAGFTDEEAIEFGRLYRAIASDLNQAQTFVNGGDVVAYLNQLVARGYMTCYGGRKPISWGRLAATAFFDYARALREFALYWLAAAALFFVGAAIGIGLLYLDPAFIEVVIPAGFPVIQPDAEESDSIDREELSAMTGLYFGNNVRVTLLVYALGLTFGVGTCWLVFNEGLRFGGLLAVFMQAGQLVKFCAEILPHGVLELPAIFIGAGGGLILARAMIVARPWSRLEELAIRGRESLRLVWGIVPLLAAAAVLEAWVARIPNWYITDYLKLAIAAIVGSAFLAYIIVVGARGRDDGIRPFAARQEA